ncbi:MAG: MarC family protein [bacterium]
MKEFWLCFVPIFVAVDAIGVLPIFLSLTGGIPPAKIRRIVYQSVLTAAVVALLFIAAGTWVLRLLGITIADFMVAGGLLLFAISLNDLLSTEKSKRIVDPASLGAVPLGVPLITGPAVLATSILLLNEHSGVLVSASVVINILLAGIVFSCAPYIDRLLGKSGAKAVSKVASLLLAAIAVMIVRKGIFLYFDQAKQVTAGG